MTNIAAHRLACLVAACIAALSLAGCGGGGGSGSASGAAPNQSTGFAGQDASAPALTGDVAVDGRNWISYRRAQIGLSTLTYNAVIDVAAQGHSAYQRINNIQPTHTQDRTRQGFTGVTVADRMRAAGFVFTGANIIGEVIAASTNQSGFSMSEDLITAIYHRFVMFEPTFKEVGTGAAKTSSGYTYFTADLAANNGLGTGLPAGTLTVWPFNGQTQVQPNFLSDYEEPDPVPDPGVNEVGYPISVHANLNVAIVVQSFTVRARGAPADLPTYQVNNEVKNADPTQSHLLTAAAIIPKTALAANTTYDVSFSGLVNGAAVGRIWSFTTR
jgi:uncharacterized protein YkwD